MQDETRNIYVLGFGARYTKGLTVSKNDNVIYSNVCYCVHLGLKLDDDTLITVTSSMSAMASQITRVSSVCSTVYSGADQRKHQSSASLDFVGAIHR